MRHVEYKMRSDASASLTPFERRILEKAFSVLERVGRGEIEVILLKATTGEWAAMTPNRNGISPAHVERVLLEYLEYASGK